MTLNFPVYYSFDYLLKYGINLLGMDTLDDKGEQLLQEKNTLHFRISIIYSI